MKQSWDPLFHCSLRSFVTVVMISSGLAYGNHTLVISSFSYYHKLSEALLMSPTAILEAKYKIWYLHTAQRVPFWIPMLHAHHKNKMLLLLLLERKWCGRCNLWWVLSNSDNAVFHLLPLFHMGGNNSGNCLKLPCIFNYEKFSTFICYQTRNLVQLKKR